MKNYKNGNNNSNVLLTKEMSNFEMKTVTLSISHSFYLMCFEVVFLVKDQDTFIFTSAFSFVIQFLNQNIHSTKKYSYTYNYFFTQNIHIYKSLKTSDGALAGIIFLDRPYLYCLLWGQLMYSSKQSP